MIQCYNYHFFFVYNACNKFLEIDFFTFFCFKSYSLVYSSGSKNFVKSFF